MSTMAIKKFIVLAVMVAITTFAASIPLEADAPENEKYCELDGVHYKSGQNFENPKVRCENCHCFNGTLNCGKIECCYVEGCSPEYNPDDCCPKWVNCTGGDGYKEYDMPAQIKPTLQMDNQEEV